MNTLADRAANCRSDLTYFTINSSGYYSVTNGGRWFRPASDMTSELDKSVFDKTMCR